jgi:hypothetical protein
MLTGYNFFGFKVTLNSDHPKLISIINQNFSMYLDSNSPHADLQIYAYIDTNLKDKIPKGLVSIKQSINSISYQKGSTRFNDYYGVAVTELDYKKNIAKIWAKDLNRLHELTYLLIMSRQGKWCDKNGIHKIHAMGIKGTSKNLLLMLPMKGGKSTMFAKFLEETKFDLISDDSPVINSNGTVSNFNIRFGLENRPMYQPLLDQIDKKHIFTLQRDQFGEKTLIDFKAFKDRISKPHKKNILIQGVRINSDQVLIEEMSKILMFKYVFVNMTIGVGLPMIIEYFIENNIKDHFGNFHIFFKRLVASIRLINNSKCYYSEMGYDIQKNFEALEKLARQ